MHFSKFGIMHYRTAEHFRFSIGEGVFTEFFLPQMDDESLKLVEIIVQSIFFRHENLGDFDVFFSRFKLKKKLQFAIISLRHQRDNVNFKNQKKYFTNFLFWKAEASF